MARAVITRVIRRRSVREMCQAQLLLHRFQRVEQLFFAVKAAVWIVARVCIELDLARVDLDQMRAHRTRERAGFVLLGLGVRRRAGQHSRSSIAQLVHGELQQKRGVDSARVRDQNRTELAHDAAGRFQSCRVERIELDHHQLQRLAGAGLRRLHRRGAAPGLVVDQRIHRWVLAAQGASLVLA